MIKTHKRNVRDLVSPNVFLFLGQFYDVSKVAMVYSKI
jgi:hypothetical protein